MDLSSAKVSGADKLDLCRKYFLGGFALLPFLWAVNAVWFGPLAFRAPPFAEQKAIRQYVVGSAVGAALSLVALIVWIVIFNQYRASWGAVADAMSFNIPTGQP